MILLVIIMLGVAFSSPDEVYVWTALNLCAITVFFAGRGLYNRIDLTEPIHWMNGLFFVMFCLHPFAMRSQGLLWAPYHYQFDISSTYVDALKLSLAAIIVCNVGYLVGLFAGGSKPLRERVTAKNDGPDKPQPAALLTLQRSAQIVTGLGMVAAVYGAAAGGSPLSAFSRSASNSSAYAYMAPYLLIPASCLWLAHYFATSRRASLRMAVVLTAFVAAVTLLGGLRTGLLLAVASPALLYFLARKKRVSRLALPVLIIGMTVLFAGLRDVNSPTGGLAYSLENVASDPVKVTLDSVSGSDSEMVDALALELQVVPNYISYRPGLIVQSSIGAIIPRSIWPDKPLTADVILNGYFLNNGVNDASVAYSIFGEQYLDSGYIGVAIYGTLIGVVYGRLYRARLTNPSVMNYVLFALSMPLLIVILRGIFAYSLAYALFLLGPVLLTRLMMTKSASRAMRGVKTTESLHSGRSTGVDLP